MPHDVLVVVGECRWAFCPQTAQALAWLEENFSLRHVEVNSRRGPNLLRALLAEGFSATLAPPRQ